MKKRSFRQDKIARVYDSEILPIWTQRFGRLLLRCAHLPSKAMALNVACQTGYPALELLQKMDDQSRIIALEASGPLLDIARTKAGELSGRRIFFRTEHFAGKLSFADDVYDLTFTNLGLEEMEGDREKILAEFARVTKPGGQVLLTLPLKGTWNEFLDIYKEVLTKHDQTEILERVEEYAASMPDKDELVASLQRAGLVEANVEVEEFTLLFKSAREFFFAPVIEYGPLRRWKGLAGKGQEMQDIFWFIKEAIDAYFTGSVFSLTVVAGCAYGIKPDYEEMEPDALLEEDPDESATDPPIIAGSKRFSGDRDSGVYPTIEQRPSLDGLEDEEDEEEEDEEPTRPPHPSPFLKDRSQDPSTES